MYLKYYRKDCCVTDTDKLLRKLEKNIKINGNELFTRTYELVAFYSNSKNSGSFQITRFFTQYLHPTFYSKFDWCFF